MSEDDMELPGPAGPEGSGDRTAALARAIGSLPVPARRPSLRDQIAPVLAEIEAALARGVPLQQIWAAAADHGVTASFDRFRKVVRQLRSASSRPPGSRAKRGGTRARARATPRPAGSQVRDRTPAAEGPSGNPSGPRPRETPARRHDSWQLFDD